MNLDLDKEVLPKNFVRKEVIRFGRPGTAKPKISTQYIDETNGKLFKTKGQLQCYLGNKIDLRLFDFKTGKLSPELILKNVKGLRSKSTGRLQLQPPIRETKYMDRILERRKVNSLKTQPTSKINHEIKSNAIDKPRQVFWEKRLSAYKTIDDDKLNLPKNIKKFGPDVDCSTAVRSIAAAFQLHSNLGIVGQTEIIDSDKNASVFINPDQPLVQKLVITEDDVRKQEERVSNARKKLSLAYRKNLVV